MMTTRLGNFERAKNSRIAKRYTMPASVKEAMKDGPPRSPKWHEQIVNAAHNAPPSMHTLHARVIFTIFLCPSGTALPQASPSCTGPYKALIPDAFVSPVQFDCPLIF